MSTTVFPPNWRKVFENVILVAFKKLMNEYRGWGLNLLDKELKDRIQQYRAEYAPSFLLETTVTTYIFTEFINSPLSNGLFDGAVYKNYQILREVPLKWGNGNEKIIDFVINRIGHHETVLKYSRMPVLVEAKKFEAYSLEEDAAAYDNKGGIKKDILKLLEVHVNERETIFEKVHPYSASNSNFIYILTWNIEDAWLDNDAIVNKIRGCLTDKDLADSRLINTGTKKPFVSRELFNGYKAIHWIPVDIENEESGHPKVTKWLWFFLGEIYLDPGVKLAPGTNNDYNPDYWAEYPKR